jgi:DNA helicase II / ATP-dependent DNA helicase PcrA
MSDTDHPIENPNAEHPLLQRLNPVQREAVVYGDGPLLLFAGAGSGKTRVLTHRVAYLISERHISPRQIMAVTFTNKAANEMKERIGKLIGEGAARHLWVGTFHATCARLLREHGQNIGLDRNFVVYDDSDQITLIKECLRQLLIDEKKFAPRAILSHISTAKEKLVEPERFAQLYHGYFEDICAKVYPLYQAKLRQNNAMDFDDLLTETVRLLKAHTETRERLQSRYRYILVDEYQDVNTVQYQFLKILAEKHRNLTVVGDDDQCLPPATQIATPDGDRAIEMLSVGDTVLGTGGGTPAQCGIITHKHESHYDGNVYTIKAGGVTLRGTAHHLVPARLAPLEEHFYVYLMYREDRGYRIGMTKSSRRGYKAGKSHDQLGFIVRSIQEHADRLWILRVTDSLNEARFYEELYAAKYGLPKMVFHTIGRDMPVDEAWIQRLYDAIDTRSAAEKLFAALDMRADMPHYRPQNGAGRQCLNAVMFGGYRTSRVMNVGEHRVQWCSGNTEIVEKLKSAGFSIRQGRLNSFRFETCRANYKELVALAKDAAQAGGLDIQHRMRVNLETYSLMPLSHLHPTMRVVIFDGKEFRDVAVEEVHKEHYSGTVYDLEVGRLHNYVANGVLVHNSIYMWRGADVGLILQFEHDYPDAHVLKLEQNYRSSQTILDAAHGVVKNNVGRKDKKLWTERDAGNPLLKYEAENEQEEAVWIAKRIRTEVEAGRRRHRDFAVLYRTNAQSRIFEEVFLGWRVPHKIVGGLRFYERKEIKDLVAYLRVVNNPADSISLRRILNVPTRGIGATTIAALEEEVNLSDRSFWDVLQNAGELSQIQARTRIKLAEFASLIARLRANSEHATITEITQQIMDATGYQKMLEEDTSIEGQSRVENLKEFLTVTREFELQTETPTLTAFLEQVSLVADLDALNTEADSVTLMTLHAAKGLEFPVVFLSGMEEAVFPHSRSFESDREMEEERRLCYVGITRAEDELILTYANRRGQFGRIAYNPPSRFLSEIPSELFKSANRRKPTVSSFDPDEDEGTGNRGQGTGNRATRTASTARPLWRETRTPEEERRTAEAETFKIGQKVRHAVFGQGVVLRVEGKGDDTTVEAAFPNVGVKKLLLAYAKLERIP